MDYIRLGKSDLNVSRVCLGTVFRSELDEQTCIAAIHEAAEQGCNFLDCANIYRDGLSEQIIGKAIRGRRGQFVVSSKVGAPFSHDPSSGGLSRTTIMREVEATLRRLGTDYLDCYLCHFPDPATPPEETFRAMNELVQQGKVRYPGCSNYESWRLCEVLAACTGEKLAPPICNQVQYSLLDRRIEDELIPYCRSRRIGITVFATTAIGLLSGRCRYGQPPPEGSSWHHGPYNYRRAMTRHVDDVVQVVLDVAHNHGKTPSQVAMAWCLRQAGIDCVITGADTAERVRENFGAVGWQLNDEELERLNRVSEGRRLVIHKDCPEGYDPSTV